MFARYARLAHLLAPLLTLLVACAGQREARSASSAHDTSAPPPVTERRAHRVRGPLGEREDEFYWLRDDTRSAPEVMAVLSAENRHADALLSPHREAQRILLEELKARIAPEDSSVPVRKNGFWYTTRFVPGAEYPLLTRRADRPGEREQLLLDTNARAKGHAFYQLGQHEVTRDGRILAFAEDVVGRGQHTIRFRNLDTGALLPDVLVNAEWAFAWANDNRTLLYVEKDAQTLLGTRVRRHQLGTEQGQDSLVYEEHDRSFYLAVWKSRSERYLHIYAISTDVSEQWLARADDPALVFTKMLPREPRHEYLAEDRGERWIVRSNYLAPNFRIVEADAATLADRSRWRELVPEPRRGTIEELSVFRDFVAYGAREDGLLRAYLHSFSDHQNRRIELPGESYTARLDENPEPDSQTVRLSFTSLTTPDSIYDYHVPASRLTLQKREPVLGGYRPEEYETAYFTASARDGTAVPVSLAQRKGLPRDGSAPLYQMAYGAYGASEDPEFSSARVSLLQRGVVLAIAHVRGGQELGRDWYEQGRLLHKRNTFSDFIAVTDHLVRQGYVAADRVAARGASAGGLLMGAIANMAPEKYRVIVAHVPFVDVVTTMLDETIPLTSNEYDEWGDPRRPLDYRYMLSYSPYDNVRRQAYPAMFVSTSLWDSQVQYYEPVKWVSRLRAQKTDNNPLLLRIHMAASHGGKSGRFARLEQLAEEYAFVAAQLRVPIAR